MSKKEILSPIELEPINPNILPATIYQLDIIKEIVSSSKLDTSNLHHADSIFLAFHQNNPIGCIAYEKTSENWIHIQSLAVLKPFRKRGVGRDLVNHLLSHLKENEETGPVIALTLFWNNDFYRKIGFEHMDAKTAKSHDPIGQRPKHLHCVAWKMNL